MKQGMARSSSVALLMVSCGALRAGAGSAPVVATPRKLNLADAFHRIAEPWSPHVAGDVNACQVKLARMEGSFVWHQHEEEDECFLVVRGRMRMRFRTGDVDCEAVCRKPVLARPSAHAPHPWHTRPSQGEMIVVPRGVEHCPVALSESADVLLVEQAGTLNTGSAAESLGDAAHERSRAGVPLTKPTLKRADDE